MSSKNQENNSSEFPGDAINTTDEENILYPTLQADNHHHNNEHTGHVLKEGFKTNHRNLDVKTIQLEVQQSVITLKMMSPKVLKC